MSNASREEAVQRSGSSGDPAAGPPPIVFDSSRAGAAEIFALGPNGSALRQITFGQATGAFSRLPDWSPDCRWIAFQSNRDDPNNTDIYIAAADGTNVHRVTHNPGLEESPTWSPDGSQLAFALGDGESEAIWIVDVDGSSRRSLTPGATPAFQPAWSPDGSHIAFVSGSDENWDLFVARTDGSGIRNLTNTRDRHEGGPAYSPDGEQIAFDALKGGHWEIYLVDANGSHERQLTHNSFMDARPAWSPDGSEIVFHSTRAFETDGDTQDYN